MPLIPILRQSTPTADAPGTVLDRERRPTLDTRPVQQGLREFNQANRMPLTDPRAMAAPYDALGSVGKAVMQTGSIFGALAQKKQDSTDRRLINTAQMAMEDAKAQFGLFQEQNPNKPETWSAEAQRLAGETLKPFLEMKEMSGTAKADLKLMAGSWQKRFTISAETESTKANFGLTQKSYVNRANRAFLSGNIAAGDAALNEAVGGGYLALPEADGMKIAGGLTAVSEQVKQLRAESTRLVAAGQVDAARKLWTEVDAPEDDAAKASFQIQRTDALTDIDYRHAVNAESQQLSLLAETDPTEGLKQLEDVAKFTHLSPPARAEAIGKMKLAREVSAQDEVTQAKRAIDKLTPDQLKDAKLETLGLDMKQATPWHRKLIEAAIEDKRSTVDFESRFSALWAAAGEFQLSGDVDADAIAAARLETMATTLKPAYRDRVLKRLDDAQKQSGTAPVTGAAIAEATKMAFRENAFGMLPNVVREPKVVGQTPVEKDAGWFWFDKGGDDVKENDGKPVIVETADPVALAATNEKLKRATDQLEREAKLPKNKDWTTDDARNRMWELMLKEGAKIDQGPALGPNPLLQPTVNPAKEDLLKTIEKNGY